MGQKAENRATGTDLGDALPFVYPPVLVRPSFVPQILDVLQHKSNQSFLYLLYYLGLLRKHIMPSLIRLSMGNSLIINIIHIWYQPFGHNFIWHWPFFRQIKPQTPFFLPALLVPWGVLNTG